MKNLFVFILLFLSVYCFGQTEPNSSEVILVSDPMPIFPGGDKAFYKFVDENLCYPDIGCIEGKVIVCFVVEADGYLSNIKVVRGLHPLLDVEAMKVIRKMPNWSPACWWGDKPVRTSRCYPIIFKLK